MNQRNSTAAIHICFTSSHRGWIQQNSKAEAQLAEELTQEFPNLNALAAEQILYSITHLL